MVSNVVRANILPQEEKRPQKYKPFFLLFFNFLTEAYFLSSAIPDDKIYSEWAKGKRKFTLELNDTEKKTLSVIDGGHFFLTQLCKS